MKLEFIAKEKNNIIKLIQNSYPKINYNQIKSVLRKKDIRVNGKKIGENIIVEINDKIECFLPNEAEKKIPVVYEDENVLIINKPAGIEVQTVDKKYDSKSLEELTGFLPCHRLDKNTEGLVVLAKNTDIYNEIANAFKNKTIHKFYTCIVLGKPEKLTDNLIAYLLKDATKSFVKIFPNQVENSTKIQTNYSVVKTYENTSLLSVELLTGKTHQIRAHLAFIGNPVLGDDKYGNKEKNRFFKAKKQMLCASKLILNFKKQDKLYYLNDKIFEIKPSFIDLKY